MRLEDFLIRDAVLPDARAVDKRGLLDEMVARVCAVATDVKREELLGVLLERERLGSTGIGYGVAIPHGKLKGLGRMVVAFARSKAGVDFSAADSMPVHIFFLIAAPENAASAHLKVLSSISRILKDASFRRKLLKAGSADEIYEAIVAADRGGGY
jgi:PTS system nitrogen regulatory IIA component